MAAVFHRTQLSCAAALPHPGGGDDAAARRFAESAYIACPKTPMRNEYLTPVLYAHDANGFRVASPLQIIEQAQMLITQRFHRDAPLLDQPSALHALLQVQLASHPNAVFAVLFLNRRMRLIGSVELFQGTIDHVVVHPREVVREALRRNAEVMIVARNDPAGDAEPSPRDIANATRLRDALVQIDVRLVDFIIVGETITSLAEREVW